MRFLPPALSTREVQRLSTFDRNMSVKMLETARGNPDGLMGRPREYEKGIVYDINGYLGNSFIAAGLAVRVSPLNTKGVKNGYRDNRNNQKTPAEQESMGSSGGETLHGFTRQWV